MTRRQTRRERDTIDSAWHEAGHAAAAIALEMPVSSVRVIPERATVGRMVGRTQLDASWLIDASRSGVPDDLRRRLDLQALAGDAVDMRREDAEDGRDRLGWPIRRRIFGGAHVLEMSERHVEAEVRALLAEARALVDDHWPMVATIAGALLASTDHGIYGEGIPGNVLYCRPQPVPVLSGLVAGTLPADPAHPTQ